MFVRTWGDGSEGFLGIHGWAGNHRTFAGVARKMPSNATFHSVDLPGYGNTPQLENLTVEGLGSSLVDVVENLPQREVTLIGNCSGAIFGLFVAQRVPDRIRRLVLIDPFAFIPWYFGLFLKGEFGRRAYMSTFANPIGRWITNRSLRRQRVGETDLTRSFAFVDHEVIYRYLQLLGGLGEAAQFSDLTMPIDILYGERTFAAVKQSVEIWRGMWPQAEAWELPESGHMPLQEATDHVARRLYLDGTRVS